MLSSFFNTLSGFLKDRKNTSNSESNIDIKAKAKEDTDEVDGDNLGERRYVLDGVTRRRAFTVDDTPLILLDANLHDTGLDGHYHVNKRQRTPEFYVDRLQKCISLPNLFRTSSIQDKSLKITRKRRKYGRHWRKNQYNSNSESENEAAGIQPENRDLSKEIALNNGTANCNLVDQNHLTKTQKASDTIDSIYDQSSSSSDEYCSCEEDLSDYNENFLNENNNAEMCRQKALNRISSIQKRSWTIRQRRKENFYKRRSVDVSTLSQP